MLDASSLRHQLVVILGLTAALLVAVSCYWPALSGPFIFDDLPNLKPLGEAGGITDSESFIRYVGSGSSGPLGRPLSLASFVVNGQYWPTDPGPFKFTNLMLHLLNGLLIFILARQLFSVVYPKEKAEKLAALCTALWLLHPLLVSTTAYVVQRMTQLGSLFILSGLIGYMHGRVMLASNPQKAWSWILGGMGISGALALLSKEIGILLPLYALTIEFTLFRSNATPPRPRKLLIGILCIPLVAMLGYLCLRWNSILSVYEFRPFNLQERLYTQTTVLTNYLSLIVKPSLSGLGLVHDDYPISRSLTSPITTLFSLAIIFGLLASAILLRKRLPLISLGILWFFAGHSLEAGPIALELYFEHRNYLPLLGPLVALCSILPYLRGKLRIVVPAALGFFLAIEAFTTHQTAKVWSDYRLLTHITALEHPNSLRAQLYLVENHITHGQLEAALEILKSLSKTHPHSASVRLGILNLECALGKYDPTNLDRTVTALQKSRYDNQMTEYFPKLILLAEDKRCRPFDLNNVHRLLDALLTNPLTSNRQSSKGAMHYYKGLTYHKQRKLNAAIKELDSSYKERKEIDIRFMQSIWLMRAGRLDEAQHYLDLAREHEEKRPWLNKLRQADINGLQTLIYKQRKNIKDQQTQTSTNQMER